MTRHKPLRALILLTALLLAPAARVAWAEYVAIPGPEPIPELILLPQLPEDPPLPSTGELPPSITRLPAVDENDQGQIDPWHDQLDRLPPVEAESPPELERLPAIEADSEVESVPYLEHLPPVEEPYSPVYPEPAPVAAEPANAPSAPSDNREQAAIEQLAGEHVKRGFSLANRHAYFSARSEFVEALRMLATASDTREGSRRSGDALSAGLRALDEANDFIPGRAAVDGDLNLATIVSSHRTPGLKDDYATSNTTLARQKYYTYAQRQMADAIGSSRSGSMALYGLGRVESTLTQKNAQDNPAGLQHAVVYQQAALTVAPENHLAANELGVLLAHFGQNDAARDALTYSLRLHPQATAWHNLAIVNERIGDAARAQQARQQSDTLARQERERPASDVAGVKWSGPEDFVRQSRTPTNLK